MKEKKPSQVGFQVSGGLGCDGLFSPCSFAQTNPSGMIVGTQTGVTPTVYDSGTMTAAIGSLPTASYAWGSSDTPATIAAGLAAAINSKDAGSASASATTVNGVAMVQVSSKATGYGINWPIALSTTYNTNSFTSASFSGTTTNVAGGYPAVAGTSGSSTYTQFVYSPAGQKMGIVINGKLVKGTVPLPGGASAVYYAGGLNYIRHKDWLGSSRLATYWAHGVYSKTAYAPFGESYNQTGTTDLSFTGEDQDTSSGVYDFQFRKFDPIAGRWMSPDPSGLYYADPSNPQSLNLYNYALNNPLSSIDPNGLECVWDDGSYDSADDPQTGNADGCAGQGGTYVNPYLFETAWLTNGQQANYQYGDWSNQANSVLAASWIDSSANFGDISGAPNFASDGSNWWITDYSGTPGLANDGSASSYGLAVIQGVAQQTGWVPSICTVGAFYYYGKGVTALGAKGFVGGIVEHDSEAGTSGGSLVEGGAGTVGAGRIDSTHGTSYLVYDEVAEIPFGGSAGGIAYHDVGGRSGVGGYAEVEGGGRERGAGVYASAGTMGGCNHR